MIVFKGTEGGKLRIRLAKTSKVTVQGVFQNELVRVIGVMSLLTASNTPALFNGIKVRGVGR